MGKCTSKCSQEDSVKYNPSCKFVYSINKYNSQIIPACKNDKPLKFDIRIFNFKAKGLSEDKYYTGKIIFGENKEKVFYLNVVMGPDPKFNLDEAFFMEIEFEKMKSTYLDLHFYKINSEDSQSISTSDMQKLLEKETPFASLSVDFMTIAIGSEHHDINLVSWKQNKVLGRLSFYINCQQVEEVTLDISSIIVKLNNCIQNEISFKLKYMYENSILETDYTAPIQGVINTKGSSTTYKWTKDNLNTLTIKEVILSINELRSSNLEIVIYEAKYEMPKNHPCDVSESVNQMEDEFRMSGRLKFDTTNHKVNDGQDDLQPTRSFDKMKFTKVLTKNTVIEKYDSVGHKTMLEKQQIEESSNILLLRNFNEFGYSRINFYSILSEKDNVMLRQSSRVFHTFSYLYQHRPTSTGESSKNLMKPSKEEGAESVVIDHQSRMRIFSGDPMTIEQKVPFTSDFTASKVIMFKIFDEATATPFKEDIIHNGKIIGEIEGTITIHHIPLIKQIMCGVHTEKGLDISPCYNYNSKVTISSNESELPKEVKEIAEITALLVSMLISNTSLTMQTLSYREMNIQISNTLESLIKPLSLVDKDGRTRYEIKTEYDHIRVPQILLDLGINLINILDSLNNEHRTIAFQIIELLLERDELALKSLSILANVDKNKEKNQLKAKVLEDFLDFMTRTLDNTLEKLSKKVNDEPTRKFLAYFLSVAYFRIPKFQKEFLTAVNVSDCIQVDNSDKSHMIDANLDENNPMMSLIDWESLFYSKLVKIKGINYQEKMDELEKVISKNNWQERIRQKGLGFYCIFSRLERYVYSKLGKVFAINWMSVPGFKIIIESIVTELRNREVVTYPQFLLNSLKIFINDHEIMNRFYKTIISRTNAYDSPSVFVAIKILDSFFDEYEQKKNLSFFSSKFDYNLLKCAFHVILDIDHSLSVAKILWFYYKNLHVMSIIHVNEMLTDIFKNKFFKLFFHWSWHVRDMFYHLLWFIISHRLQNKNYLDYKKNLFEERMENLINKNEEGFYKAFHNDYYQKMKSSIMTEYYEKVRTIEVIRSIVRKERLDPTYKNEIHITNAEISEKLTDDIKKCVVVGIHHYDAVEKVFNAWKKENKNNKDPKYPELILQPPKDDFAEYTSTTAEHW